MKTTKAQRGRMRQDGNAEGWQELHDALDDADLADEAIAALRELVKLYAIRADLNFRGGSDARELDYQERKREALVATNAIIAKADAFAAEFQRGG